MKNIFPIIFQVVFISCFYIGFFENVEGARNVSLFYIWLMIVATFVSASNKKTHEEQVKEANKRGVIPAWAHISIQCFVIFGLLWNAWWITAVVFLIAVGLIHNEWEKETKLRETLKQEQQKEIVINF